MRGRHGGGGGTGGNCICLKCGAKVPHTPGSPCREAECPRCGTKMVQEGSMHHKAFEKKRAQSEEKS